MIKQIVTTLLAAGACFPTAIHAQAVHGHLNVGALSKEQSSPLIWENGADFIASSGYVKTLNYTSTGRFAGYYEGNITLTVLPATEAHSGPDPLAPALGSFIQFKMACISGPPGGAFNFWESGTTEPSIFLVPGEESSTLWRLTESEGNPGDDPYGHFHGRRFSATRPGLYKVAFTPQDTSVNGTGGGPIHTPGPTLQIWFQAGIAIAEISRTGDGTKVTFGTLLNSTFTLEFSENLLPSPEWIPIGEPVAGTDSFVTLEDKQPQRASGFYRVKAVTNP